MSTNPVKLPHLTVHIPPNALQHISDVMHHLGEFTSDKDMEYLKCFAQAVRHTLLEARNYDGHNNPFVTENLWWHIEKGLKPTEQTSYIQYHND